MPQSEKRMGGEFQDRLIHVALRKSYLDPDKVRRAFQMLRNERRKGRRVRLHEVLLENDLLTREQLLDIRRTMSQEGIHMRLDDFEVLSRLGRGAMGTVYCAWQRSLDRNVALKVLAGYLAANDEFVERFLREARMAARVRHPNVVQVYDVGRWRGTHYIVMEYVPGLSLERILASSGRLPEGRAISIGIQVCRALQGAQAAGVIHRDIKPGNILVTPEGTAKLADLGLAVASSDDEAASGGGTPYYISPEQARNDPRLDIRSDIYSLGCTLFHAATGRVPFAGATAVDTLRMHAEALVPDAASLRPDLSPEFCRILRKMMAKDPEERFAGPAELVAALEALSAGMPPPPLRGRPRRVPRWVVGFIVAGIVLLVAFVMLMALNARRHGPPPATEEEIEELLREAPW